jgi:GT2 family glycosyltransferase
MVIVDNGSTDGSVEYLSLQFPSLKIISLKSNQGFGYANNVGAKEASGEHFLFLNNDTTITSDFITPLVRILENIPDAGIVGPKLLNNDGSFQLSFGDFPSLMNEWKTRRLQLKHLIPKNVINDGNNLGVKVDWVSGAALMIRRSLFEKIGGFDENFFMYFEDSDLCFRAKKAGFSIYWFSDACLIHHKGKSYTSENKKVSEEYRKSQLHYYKIHRSWCEKEILKLYLIIKHVLLFFRRNI